MAFTPHQLRALETNHHVAVTANAGSGKTRVLVERYFRLVAGGAALSEVLALTYTEKAAGELKRKIAERIRKELQEPSGDFAVGRLVEVRNGFATAFVGTIHSFCARLLREFPVEAGVDASFSVMEEIDSSAMIADAVNESLAAALAGEIPAVTKEHLLTLVRDLGKTKTRDLLHVLVRRRDLRERMERNVYSSSDDRVVAHWKDELEGAFDRARSDPGFLSDAAVLLNAASGKERAAVAETFDALRASGDRRAQALLLLRMLEGMLTREGSLRRAFAGKEDEGDGQVAAAAGRLDTARRTVLPIAGFVAAGSPAEAHRTLLRAGRSLLALAAASTVRYENHKQEEGRLDFEDLQLVMRDLLAHEGVRAQLVRRFRYVMVDEFQDTNALQLDILLPLLDHLASGNLFVVGDPKQSIYRFREADVRVFSRTTRNVIGVAGERGDVRLGESFRPLRNIAAFVNLLFGPLVPEDSGIGYERMVVARPNEAPGAVEILVADPSAAGGLSEADLVVRRILSLVREETPVFDVSEVPRPVRFGDIALLLRGRNALPPFEEAFIRGGVPYAVSGGVGYFQTQDVYDTYNYLRFLTDPDDDIALAGILRSPYFNVSDADLFHLSDQRGGETLWKALEGVGRTGVPSLVHAYRILSEDRAVGVRLPVPELLTRIIGQSHLPGALAGTPRGPQAMANLDKLISMARQFERLGFNGLYDFVARLRLLMEEEEKEGQATIDTRADAVRVMTIHASKGLEFPVVFVPKLNASFGRDPESYIDEDLGLGFRPAEGDLPPIVSHMRVRERARQVEEERRIFYVACTRARDTLVLSADTTRAPRGRESWFTWLRSALGEDQLARERASFIVETERFSVPGDTPGGSSQIHSLDIPIYRSLPVEPAPMLSPPAAAERRVIDLGRPESVPHGEIFSASKVRTYLECPSKYYFRYVLGYPLGTGPFAGGEEEEMGDRDYPAELRGRIFHAVMEEADLLHPAGSSVEEAVAAVMSRDLHPARDSALGTDVSVLVRGVLSSDAWAEIASGTDVKTEFSISAALGGDFITGTIDRLYRDHDGIWTILDYKTDAVSAADAERRSALYWPQLAFYAVMVQRFLQTERIRTRIMYASHPDLRFVKEFDSFSLGHTVEAITSVIRNIRAGNFPGRASACHGCPLPPGQCRGISDSSSAVSPV